MENGSGVALDAALFPQQGMEVVEIKGRDKAEVRCPKCDRHLKKMRCRIDDSELYCTNCGHSFDAQRLKSEAGK